MQINGVTGGMQALQVACENESQGRKICIAIGYLINFSAALTIGLIYVIWLVNVNKIEQGVDIVCERTLDKGDYCTGVYNDVTAYDVYWYETPNKGTWSDPD